MHSGNACNFTKTQMLFYSFKVVPTSILQWLRYVRHSNRICDASKRLCVPPAMLQLHRVRTTAPPRWPLCNKGRTTLLWYRLWERNEHDGTKSKKYEFIKQILWMKWSKELVTYYKEKPTSQCLNFVTFFELLNTTNKLNKKPILIY